MWKDWIHAVLGLWIVLVAFLGLSGSALMLTLVVTGLAVAVLGLWGAGSFKNA